jgi:hypothetical protein
MNLITETIVTQEYKNFRWRRSSLLASVEISVLHATEAYSSLDLTNAEHNMKRLSMDGKGQCYSTNTAQQLENLWKYIVHVIMKIKFSIKNNSQIFNSNRTIYTRSTNFILEKNQVSFLSKGNNYNNNNYYYN